jgi:transposase
VRVRAYWHANRKVAKADFDLACAFRGGYRLRLDPHRNQPQLRPDLRGLGLPSQFADPVPKCRQPNIVASCEHLLWLASSHVPADHFRPKSARFPSFLHARHSASRARHPSRRPPSDGYAEIDDGKGPPGALTTAEKEELSHLRREVKVLRMEREILKRAATFFAKESA